MEASPSRASAAGMVRLVVAMDGVDPALVKALAQGTYVVDPRAVADAIIRRNEDIAEARSLSRVLVAAQLDRQAIVPADDEPAADADVA
jgi:hypothetical protein